MKKNDFIVASINNPDFTVADFKDISEMNLGNTQMLSEEEYLKSKFIKENPLFQDSNGNFVKLKFSDFYRLKLRDFSEFSTESSLDNYLYGLFDTFRKANSKIRPFGVSFERVPNSERRSIGIVGPNQYGERTFSDRELAQREKVFDYKEGKFRDYSPNDLAFTKNPFAWIGSLFDDPLVLATYDENGTHYDPILGREVQHAKGLKKLNDHGLPYYETLAGRSAARKDILSITDNLTVDGSWLNKYDFFDSDDMDKSVSGTIMKNLSILAPAFIPGVGEYYAGTLVVREMMKSLPMLYGMAGLFNNDLPLSSIVNTIGAIGSKFTGNTTDYAKEKMFSFENFGSLIADVSLLWSLQQWIINNLSKIQKANIATLEAAKAKALGEYSKRARLLMTLGEKGEIAMSRVTQLTGAKNREALEELIKGDNWMHTVYGGAALELYVTPALKKIASKTKIAQDLSLGYMAIISNTDVYEDALARGTSKREAAMLALGSTVGMFSVDKYLGLGEMFYNPALRAERSLFRNTLLDETKKITDQLKQLTPEVKVGTSAVTDTKKGLGRYFLKGIKAGRDAVLNYKGAIKEGTLGFAGKAIGEGLEEVSEELVTDIVKQLGEIAADYGLSDVSNLGAWDNMKDRYLMSFLGGTIGGGIFALKDGNFKSRQASGELLTLLRQGRGLEVRDELKRLHDKGLLGSTELSYKTALTYDDKNNPQAVFLSADENNQSLNDYAYNILTQSIELIETILLKNHLIKSESELFDDLVLQDENYTALKDYLQDASYITGYLRRYLQLVKNIVALELKIRKMEKSDGEARANKEEIEKAKKDLNEMLLERDRFFNGDHSLKYLLKMLFAINPQLAGAFMPLTKKLYTRALLGVDYDYLDGGMKDFVDRVYEQAVKDPSKIEEELDKAFDKFLELQPLMEDILSKHTGGSTLWENIRKTLDEKGILKNEDVYTVNSLLPGEDEESESYKFRTTRIEGESEVDFANRLRERTITAAEHNARLKIEKLQAVLDEAKTFDTDPTTGMVKPASFIDTSTKRYLLAYLGETQKHIKDRIIARTIGTSINKDLLAYAENYDELINKVRDSLKIKFERSIGEDFLNYLGTKDYGGLSAFYGQLSPKPKFTLEEVLKNLNRDGWEDYTIPEQLAAMFEDTTGMEGDFDFILDAAKYNELYSQYMGEVDPDKEAELKEQLNKLGQKEYQAWNEDYFNEQVKQLVENEITRLEPQLQKLNKELLRDKDLQIAKDIEERLSIEDNPAVLLVKEIAPKIGGSAVEVEKALESIHKLFMESEKSYDFILSGDQIKYLQEAKQLIGIVTAMIAASSRPSNILDGMTYNKAVNKFYADHKDKQPGSEFFKNFEPLFEMDEKIGGQLIMALNGYTLEIDQWILLSRLNLANSTASLLRASEALDNARLLFLSSSMDSNEFLKDSIIDPNDLYALYLYEKQFHDNVIRAIESGRDIKDIIKSLVAHINLDDEIISGITSNIDEELRDLTPYDKLMYLVSLIAEDPIELLELELKFIKDNPKIAPLATLRPSMLLGKALASKSEVINTALEVLLELAKAKGLNPPVMWNTTIVTGLGGGGKTSVVGKFISDDDENTWIAGPTDSLTKTLKEILPKAKVFSAEELIKSIYSGEIKSEKGKGMDKGWEPRLFIGDDSKYIVKDAPKHLLIDEATHFTTLQLQILANWARKAGVRITLLGDENQRGKEYNLSREAIIAYRTPRLNFSLRNESIWKVLNLNQLVSMLDRMRNSSQEVSDAVFKQILDILHNKINLSYFENESTLEGDKVVSKITALELSRLSGSVAYIGDNKDIIEFIKANLKSGTTFESVSKDEVLGREFDYVIVDSDWEGKLAKGISGKFNYESSISSAADMLRDIYTMISRSRKGSIILDNLISNIVNSVKEEYTTKYERLSEDTIKNFIDARVAQIEDILENIKPETTEEVIIVEEPEKHEETLEEPPASNISLDELDEIETVERTEKELKPIGYRAYGNVAFIGNVVIGDKKLWILLDGPIRDIGLFAPLAKDRIIATTGREKRELVHDLNYIKSLFLYDLNIDLYDIPQTLRRVITKDALKKATFHLVAEDKDYRHNLTGLTTLKLSEVSFMDGKVISILARIETPFGPAIITLGAVSDPDTWRQMLENPELSTDEKEELRAQINHYEELLKNLINSEKLEIQINRPKFSGRTELVKLRLEDTEEFEELLAQGKVTAKLGKQRRSIRLEHLYLNTSEFDARTGNSVVSPIHIITSPIPGISPKLVGHAVMFVSNNNTLAPDLLGKLFIQQLKDRASGIDSKAQVRMIVLDNEGVSFHSLYRGGFKDIYSTTSGSNEFEFPVNLLATSIRMFASLWNFRADLNRFINAINTFLKDKGITRQLLIEMAKLDTLLYQELLKLKASEYEALNGKLPESDPVISNSEYKHWLQSYSDIEKAKKVLALIEFNENLDIPRFRVGWSDRTGAYIRRIHGLKEGNPYYKNVKNWNPEDTNGIFINPDLAYLYLEMLNYLFDNVVNVIYDTTKLNSNESVNYKEVEKWLLLSKGGSLTVDNNGTTITIPEQARVKAFPLILTKIASYMHRKMHYGNEEFLNRRNNGRYHVYVDPTTKKEEIEYTKLDSFLKATIDGEEVTGLLQESSTRKEVIGQNDFTYEDSGDVVYLDARLDNFFNLIFHGVPFEKSYNDFNDGQLTETLALFKYGFFNDPVLLKNGGRASDMIAPCSTNRKLFKTDVIPGNPLLEFDFNEVTQEEQGTEEIVKLQNPLVLLAQALGIDTSGWNIDSLSDDIILLFVKELCKEHNKVNYFDKGVFDASKIIVEVTPDSIITLKDKYSELANIINVEPSGDGRYFTIKNADGLTFKIIYDNGEIIVNNTTDPGNRRGQDKVISTFNGTEINSAINNFIESKEQYKDSDELLNWMSSNEGIDYSLSDLKLIRKDLRHILDEEGILDNSDIILLENIIDEFINQINTTDCNGV